MGFEYDMERHYGIKKRLGGILDAFNPTRFKGVNTPKRLFLGGPSTELADLDADTETDFDVTYTLPKKTLVDGDILRAKALFKVTGSNSGNLTFRVKVAGFPLSVVTEVAPPINGLCVIDLLLVVRDASEATQVLILEEKSDVKTSGNHTISKNVIETGGPLGIDSSDIVFGASVEWTVKNANNKSKLLFLEVSHE